MAPFFVAFSEMATFYGALPIPLAFHARSASLPTLMANSHVKFS